MRLFGPVYVCALYGCDFTRASRRAWFNDAECRRCNAYMDPGYDPADE